MKTLWLKIKEFFTGPPPEEPVWVEDVTGRLIPKGDHWREELCPCPNCASTTMMVDHAPEKDLMGCARCKKTFKRQTQWRNILNRPDY